MFAGCGFGLAQTASSAPSSSPAASCPATPTLEALTKALDAAVSGPGTRDRTCLRAVLMPEARLIPVARGKDGQIAAHVLTVDDWISRVRQRGDAVFYEHQIAQKIESFGHIAHLWSTYEIRDTPEGKAEMRGINSIQAINDGTNWRVMEIVWETEGPGQPIPDKYLR